MIAMIHKRDDTIDPSYSDLSRSPKKNVEVSSVS